MDFACVDLALIADPLLLGRGRHYHLVHKIHPSNASYFPKVKFGTIALLILRHTVESTTVGCDSISGWEADERVAIGCSLTRFLRSDVYSSRRRAQFSEQCSAQHGLDLNKDDMGVSAFDGSCIVYYLPCVGDWTADAAGHAKCCPRRMRIRIAAVCANCANLL
jgi:hypothetical protein